jgi:hypothetical protein
MTPGDEIITGCFYYLTLKTDKKKQLVQNQHTGQWMPISLVRRDGLRHSRFPARF